MKINSVTMPRRSVVDARGRETGKTEEVVRGRGKTDGWMGARL